MKRSRLTISGRRLKKSGQSVTVSTHLLFLHVMIFFDEILCAMKMKRSCSSLITNMDPTVIETMTVPTILTSMQALSATIACIQTRRTNFTSSGIICIQKF